MKAETPCLASIHARSEAEWRLPSMKKKRHLRGGMYRLFQIDRLFCYRALAKLPSIFSIEKMIAYDIPPGFAWPIFAIHLFSRFISYQFIVRKFMVNFAKRNDGVVSSALAVAIDLMKDLKWRMAIRISAFSMCMSNDFAFFTGGNVAGYSTSIRRRLRCASITGDT